MKPPWGHSLRASLLVVVVLGGSGCAAGAKLGGSFLGALLGGLLSPSSSAAGSSGQEPLVSTETTADGETPCRQKQGEWRRAEGNPRTEPPAYLRCGPHGEWPDEAELRTAGRPPSL